MESSSVYELRKREASYHPYIGTIADFFAAQLFSAPFTVRAINASGQTAPADPFYASLREDVDGTGTDLATLMKDRFTAAMVKRTAWILAEMPDDGGVPVDQMSLLDWNAAGLGSARLCPLDADDVLDWEVDEGGSLIWAITYRRSMRRDDPRLERSLVTETWRLYDAETVETFAVTYDPSKRRIKADDVIPSLRRRPHRFPRVPLVPLRLPEGLWLLNRAADAQIEHFRLGAALSWAIRRAAYPMAVFKSKDQGQPIPTTGAGYAITIGVDESLTWVAPDAAPFEVLSAEVDTQKNEIYRIAQQMAASVNNNAAALGRSGESKQADQAATEICLHAYATHVKATVEELYELVSDARGDGNITWSIEGMNRFSLSDVTTTLANIQTAVSLSIPSKTLKTELFVKAADALHPDASQETKDQIRVEITDAAEEPAKEPPPPPNPAGEEPTGDGAGGDGDTNTGA